MLGLKVIDIQGLRIVGAILKVGSPTRHPVHPHVIRMTWVSDRGVSHIAEVSWTLAPPLKHIVRWDHCSILGHAVARRNMDSGDTVVVDFTETLSYRFIWGLAHGEVIRRVENHEVLRSEAVLPVPQCVGERFQDKRAGVIRVVTVL